MLKELLKELGLGESGAGNLLKGFGLRKEVSGLQCAAGMRASGTEYLESFSPINGQLLAKIQLASVEDYEQVVQTQLELFKKWRTVPAPVRGQLIYKINLALRENRDALGKLITWEMGKIVAEGVGEVQEAIDIADLAVGLSRQLYGQTMHSERPAHRMYEQWHPLGVIGVISAFNFPMAVWAWNSMLATVCGNVVLWKPSELTPLSALAINGLCNEVARQAGFDGLFSLVIGDRSLGEKMALDTRIPLISATGSCRMGKSVAEAVAGRFGRCLLELGGNNAIIVTDKADLDLVVRSTLFGSVGTAGQRCTTTRRVIIDRKLESEFTTRMLAAYKQVKIGNPLDDGILMGPLINRVAVNNYLSALEAIKAQGGKILCGGEVCSGMPSDTYVTPVLVQAKKTMPIIREETFAPILYIIGVDNLSEALEVHNDVPQGLSSAIFTSDLVEAETFLSSAGSDCGIANVNLGTSGAEIGGAFGGEKETGGGREAGSDCWKQYMRRQTSTINFSGQLPLAQGIKFEVS